MRRIFWSMAAIGAAAGLAACNMSSGSSDPAPVAAAPPAGAAAPAWPALPAAACADSLNSYQKVLTADVTSGNLNKTVYDQIEADLLRAANACAAGKDGEALGIIRSTKAKHGYRA